MNAQYILEETTLEALKILTDENEVATAIRALNDESRRRILYALRARKLSTAELCEFLEKEYPSREIKPQTVRYHLKELERASLIEQDGYAPSGNGESHIMMKLWRATAESVFIATGNMDELPERTEPGIEKSLDIMTTMRHIGFQFDDNEAMKSLAQDFVERDKLWMHGREEAQKTLEDVSECDPGLYIRLRRILSVITLNDADYKQYWELSRSVTDRLRQAWKKGKGKNPEVY
jgi:DNA-binding transcriptional ArsR family regulator